MPGTEAAPTEQAPKAEKSKAFQPLFFSPLVEGSDAEIQDRRIKISLMLSGQEPLPKLVGEQGSDITLKDMFASAEGVLSESDPKQARAELVNLKKSGKAFLDNLYDTDDRKKQKEKWEKTTDPVWRKSVRVAEMMILKAEMEWLKMRQGLELKGKMPSLTAQEAGRLKREFERYARNADVPPKFVHELHDAVEHYLDPYLPAKETGVSRQMVRAYAEHLAKSPAGETVEASGDETYEKKLNTGPSPAKKDEGTTEPSFDLPELKMPGEDEGETNTVLEMLAQLSEQPDYRGKHVVAKPLAGERKQTQVQRDDETRFDLSPPKLSAKDADIITREINLQKMREPSYQQLSEADKKRAQTLAVLLTDSWLTSKEEALNALSQQWPSSQGIMRAALERAMADNEGLPVWALPSISAAELSVSGLPEGGDRAADVFSRQWEYQLRRAVRNKSGFRSFRLGLHKGMGWKRNLAKVAWPVVGRQQVRQEKQLFLWAQKQFGEMALRRLDEWAHKPPVKNISDKVRQQFLFLVADSFLPDRVREIVKKTKEPGYSELDHADQARADILAAALVREWPTDTSELDKRAASWLDDRGILRAALERAIAHRQKKVPLLGMMVPRGITFSLSGEGVPEKAVRVFHAQLEDQLRADLTNTSGLAIFKRDFGKAKLGKRVWGKVKTPLGLQKVPDEQKIYLTVRKQFGEVAEKMLDSYQIVPTSFSQRLITQYLFLMQDILGQPPGKI